MFQALIEGKILVNKNGLRIRKDSDGMVRVFTNKDFTVPDPQHNPIHTFHVDSWELLETKVKDKEMKNKFKVGDRVRVVKKVESQEGWYNEWFDGVNCEGRMSNYINKEFRIARICNSGISFVEDSCYYFPSDSLELVIDSPKSKKLLTEADIMQALLDKETLIDRDGDKYKLGNNALLRCCPEADIWRECKVPLVNILANKPKIYKEVIETSWYENIPEKGRLCWVTDEGTEDRDTLEIICSYFPDNYPFKTERGCNWAYATPLTDEEIKQFLQDK